MASDSNYLSSLFASDKTFFDKLITTEDLAKARLKDPAYTEIMSMIIDPTKDDLLKKAQIRAALINQKIDFKAPKIKNPFA